MTFTSPLLGAQPGFSSEEPAGTSILPQYCMVALPWGPQEAAPLHTHTWLRCCWRLGSGGGEVVPRGASWKHRKGENSKLL